MYMKDLILAVALPFSFWPPAAFRLLVAILTSFVDHHIHEVTKGRAGLGNMEIKRQEKGVVRPVTVQKPKVHKSVPKTASPGSMKVAGTEPVKVSCMQMWIDLQAAGVKKEKIDQQLNDVLFPLWRQLLVEQRFQKPPKKGSSPRPVCLQDYLGSSGEEEFDL